MSLFEEIKIGDVLKYSSNYGIPEYFEVIDKASSDITTYFIYPNRDKHKHIYYDWFVNGSGFTKLSKEEIVNLYKVIIFS